MVQSIWATASHIGHGKLHILYLLPKFKNEQSDIFAVFSGVFAWFALSFVLCMFKRFFFNDLLSARLWQAWNVTTALGTQHFQVLHFAANEKWMKRLCKFIWGKYVMSENFLFSIWWINSIRFQIKTTNDTFSEK